MNESYIISALTQAYLDVGLDLPTAYPNAFFDPAGKDLWVAVSFLPVHPEPVTLGEQGMDESTGIFQLDINCLLGSGTSEVSAVADQLRNSFTAGQKFVYMEQVVDIVSCGREPAIESSNYFRIPVSVIWSSRLTRAKLT